MSKQSKGGGGNMLLLAGLGVGAFMLLSKKSNAQTDEASRLQSGAGDSDIPEAPAILAVNNSSTESPTPTGIVSDEEGMVSTKSSYNPAPSAASSSYEESEDGEDTGASSAVARAGAALITQAATKLPAVISTKLTPKEQAVVSAGKLTAELALKRPDLYKAAYIKKHGGTTQAGKRKALSAATLAIDAAVNAVKANNSGGLTKAVKYPAKPQNTFVQTAGGMMAQTALSKIAAVQKAGVKISPAAQKVSAQVKAAKNAKPKPAAKKKAAVKQRVPKRPAAKARVVRPATKKPSPKKR